VLYVWVEVGLGGSYKLDELRVTFSTPQLKLIFHKSDEATPQELAALIARYTKVPGIKIGDERRDPVATAETVTLYFYRRGIAQVVGGIAEVVGDIEQIVPIRLRGTRVHYVMIRPNSAVTSVISRILLVRRNRSRAAFPIGRRPLAPYLGMPGAGRPCLAMDQLMLH